VWRVIPEASTRAAELIAGNVDIADAVAPDQIGGRQRQPAGEGHRRAGHHPRLRGLQHGQRRSTTSRAAPRRSATRRRAGGAAVRRRRAHHLPHAALTECERATGMVNPPNAHPTLEPYPYDPEPPSACSTRPATPAAPTACASASASRSPAAAPTPTPPSRSGSTCRTSASDHVDLPGLRLGVRAGAARQDRRPGLHDRARAAPSGTPSTTWPTCARPTAPPTTSPGPTPIGSRGWDRLAQTRDPGRADGDRPRDARGVLQRSAVAACCTSSRSTTACPSASTGSRVATPASS
jgi:hypothetical protein